LIAVIERPGSLKCWRKIRVRADNDA
jgi:hypothetical protein